MAIDNKYYELLGVDSNATQDEIKKHYRKKSKQMHPDRNQNDPKATEKFQELNEAYSVLSDPEKRKSYDQFGVDFEKQQGFGGFDPFADYNPFTRRKQDIREQLHLHIKIQLTFEELYEQNTITKKLKYKRTIICPDCNGKKHAPNGHIDTCVHCNGSGMKTFQQGHIMYQMTCDKCGGEGTRIVNPCPKCYGEGLVEMEMVVDVDVTPGSIFKPIIIHNKGREYIDNNKHISGDLIVNIIPKQHNIYSIDNQGNVHVNTNVNILDCILGENIKVKCIDGTEKQFKVHIGTKDGETFRLKGLGIAINKTERTNLFVHIKQQYPSHLTDTEVEIINNLKKEKNFKYGND